MTVRLLYKDLAPNMVRDKQTRDYVKNNKHASERRTLKGDSPDKSHRTLTGKSPFKVIKVKC